MSENTLPHATVAGVIEKDSKFLMVIEYKDGQQVLNQPAGHIENGETIIQALQREVLEETRWKVKPTHALSIAQFDAPNGVTYLRNSFVCEPIKLIEDAKLDKDIIDTTWLSYEDILSNQEILRSPLVLSDIRRYMDGIRYPMNIYSGFV